jgi:hypothetical protein
MRYANSIIPSTARASILSLLVLASVLSCTVDRRMSCRAEVTPDKALAECRAMEEKELTEPPIPTTPEVQVELAKP